MDVIRRISTSQRVAPRNHADLNTQTIRLIAKVLRTVAQRERLEHLTDVVDAARRELVRLRVRYRHEQFNAAIHLVESNTRLVAIPQPRRIAAAHLEILTIGRGDAALILGGLRDRFGAVPLRTMPGLEAK